jgi:hypothetical protein
MRWWIVLIGATGLCLGLVSGVSAQQPAPEERVAALNQSLQENQARLQQYEWIETTVVSLKGEEKSRTQKRCYYGADGKVQKLAIAEPAQEADEGRRGGRRRGRLKQRVVEKKKGELTDYVKQAVELIQLYVPPDPGLIQRSKEADKAAVEVLEPERVRLTFRDYREAGDALSVELNPAANRLLGVKISTFLGTPDDPVGLEVDFGSLVDGTSYPAKIMLDAQAKGMTVAVQSSGHRKTGP